VEEEGEWRNGREKVSDKREDMEWCSVWEDVVLGKGTLTCSAVGE